MRKQHISYWAVALVCSVLSAFTASAQTTTADTGFTPYSLFGLGDPASQGSTYNFSMGGIGVADRNVRILNFINPAAVTAREAKSFMCDFGIDQTNVYYAAKPATAVGSTADGTLRSASNTFNMHHIVASFPIASHSAFKLGVTPYSNVGYSFKAKEQRDNILAEVGDITYGNVGQGGIYQLFGGAGVTLFKRLSLGADFQYYFGTIDRYSNAVFTTNSSCRTLNTGWTYVIRSASGKFGLQYEQPLSKRTFMTIGATYQLGHDIGGEVTRFAYATASNVDTVRTQTTEASSMYMPSEMAVGISVRKVEQWAASFDYSRQDWSNVQFPAQSSAFSPVCRQSFRFGFELTPNRYDIRYYSKQITYRGGLYYEKSYVALNGHQIADCGLTLGASFPILRYYNSITFGLKMGQRGTLEDNLMRERYLMFSLSFDLHDIWFIKTLYH